MRRWGRTPDTHDQRSVRTGKTCRSRIKGKSSGFPQVAASAADLPDMAFTRREMLRRLGGVSALAALWAGSKLVWDDGSGPPSVESAGSGLPPGSSGSSGFGDSRGRGTVGSLGSDSSTSPDDPAFDRTPEGMAESNPTGHDSATAHGGDEAKSMSHQHSADDSTITTSGPAEVKESFELVGQVGPLTVSRGAIATIVGDVALTGDLTVEGMLTGVDSFTLEGNGYQILAQNGGRIRLVGRRKTGWTRVGSKVSGWINGDRLAVAPTAVGVYKPTETVWKGGWGAVAAPAAVTLLDGRKMQAEVANLTRSITLKNLGRVMMHSGAGPSEFRHIALVGCGASPLGFYPLHFHHNGGSVSGSIVEGVVVEGGRNRAFVPHGSHGIRFEDCVAYNTTKRPFWWDEGQGNESHDISYQKCLAMVVGAGPGGEEKNRLAGFQLGMARRSRVVGCAVVGVQGRDDSGGFWWPGGQSLSPWDFRDNVSHNNVGHGFIVWQNTDEAHFLADSVAYRNSRSGVDHGAYRNPYTYRNMVLQENGDGVAVILHANAREQGQTYQNIRTDGLLYVDDHNQPPAALHRHINATYTRVVYNEKVKNPSNQEFVDCGLSPDDFDLLGIHPNSTIMIQESGTIIAQWQDGSWA